MADARLSFEQRKAIWKWYCEFENISEVRRQWRNEFQTIPPTRLTIVRIRHKFGPNGRPTVNDVHKERSRQPVTATTAAIFAAVTIYKFTTELCETVCT
ncbi:hypothetical protein ANN_22558 [Periplaneta americana]|uniref:DUF4817 domain-containing protein n=1 Tax=Periplaneta americana TaxID=6978 RepID=A0ABQ8S9F4_PERAM|nr:hypothetical protein ANN_22558 [Periplaneta americana]